MEIKDYKINIVNNKNSLTQVRSNGFNLNVLSLKDDTFTNITDTFFCKDYFNEFIAAEKYKKSVGPQYGFKHDYTGALEQDYFYIGISTAKYTPEIKSKSTELFKNLENFLPLIDKLFWAVNKNKKCELISVDNSEWKVIKVPTEYTDYLYIFSLYILLVRVGMFYTEGTIMEYLSSLYSKSITGIYNEDVLHIYAHLVDIKAIELGYIIKENYYLEKYIKGEAFILSSLHNSSGLVGTLVNTNIKKPYKLLYLYGSLREDMYNYNYFKSSYGDEFTRANNELYTINNYELYSLGSYPTIVPNQNSKIKAELFIVSEKVFERIDSMENGAGYKSTISFAPCDNKSISNESALIYYQDNKHLMPDQLVVSGDWVNYLTTEKV